MTTRSRAASAMQLQILPGDVFSQDRLVRSYQNIANLGFFETPVPNPDTRPDSTGDVDIIFRVKEKQTGNVNFGASAGQGARRWRVHRTAAAESLRSLQVRFAQLELRALPEQLPACLHRSADPPLAGVRDGERVPHAEPLSGHWRLLELQRRLRSADPDWLQPAAWLSRSAVAVYAPVRVVRS